MSKDSPRLLIEKAMHKNKGPGHLGCKLETSLAVLDQLLNAGQLQDVRDIWVRKLGEHWISNVILQVKVKGTSCIPVGLEKGLEVKLG